MALFRHRLAAARHALACIPVDVQPKNGVEEAPDALRDAGLAQQLEQLGWKAMDMTPPVEVFSPTASPTYNASLMGKLKNVPHVARVTKSIADAVYAAHKAGALALTIGGDHSLGIGTVAGTARAFQGKSDVAVIWVDAHAVHSTP